MTSWRERAAGVAYGTLLLAFAPVYVARLWWRGRAEPLYRDRVAERFGHGGSAAEPGAVWVHAVSLGETRAAAALVHALRVARPGLRLLLTHGTATGRAAGRTLLEPGDRQAWLPYDLPGATRRFVARHRPAVGVLMETEVWPNLLQAAERQGVPMVLANARLSARSARQGRRLAALLRPAARRLRVVLAQTASDAERLRDAGAADVRVLGNLKFDLAPDAAQVRAGRAWRAAGGRDVVLAASLREGEDPPLLAAWAALPSPRPLLLVVPRHPQRFDEVATRIRGSGFTLARRSTWADTPPPDACDADVWLGDSLGEMALYYSLADVALLGGSFAPLGGQNLIEAAACGCPVVMGPHTFNFALAAELAVEAGAARRVDTLASAVAAAHALVSEAPARRTMAEAASAFAGRHRGAAARMAAAILELVPTPGDALSAPAGDPLPPRPAR